MKRIYNIITHELRHHAPFTFFGAVSGVVLIFVFQKLPREYAYNIFYVLHPFHVVLSALVIVFVFYCIIELFGRNGLDSRYIPRRWIKLDEQQETPNDEISGNAPSSLSIRVAVAPVISPEKSLAVYQWFVDIVLRWDNG